MNTCATCKFFWIGSGDLYGECAQAVGSKSVMLEHWPLGAIIYPRPDFGCTLWQARDGVLGNMMTDGRSSWPKENK